MSEIAAAAAAVLALVCELPGVVDVGAANRHGTEEVVVTVTDSSWYERVSRKAGATVRVRPLFGLGSFTGNTLATKWADFVTVLPGASTYGTRMQRFHDRLLNDVMRREAEAWNAMGSDAQAQAVTEAIAQQRSKGQTGFGNCWQQP